MALQGCESCGAACAVGLRACPQCQAPAGNDAEEAGMAKITSAGPSHADTAAVPAGLKPDAELLEEHPGYDSQGHATGHPADGTMSPAVSNGEPVRAQPEPGASPAQAAVPPRGPVPAPPREQE